MNLARWITSISRICRVYVSKNNLTKDQQEILDLMVCYIMRVYIPVWFQLKKTPVWYEAPRIYLDLVKRVSTQDKRVRDIVQPVLQNGAYCLHEVRNQFRDAFKIKNWKKFYERDKNIIYGNLYKKSLFYSLPKK